MAIWVNSQGTVKLRTFYNFVVHAKLLTAGTEFKIESVNVSSMCNNIMFAFSLQFPLLSSLHGRVHGTGIL